MIDDDSAARRALARAALPLQFRHDPALPITLQREAILKTLAERQVLIVAGDTGSGKSTQLPQYCLELGRGTAGLIAHTQPRRIAARALASRVAEELGQSVGRTVGFRVRFADQVSDATRVVLMTDGLLLAELASDPMLRRYDTVIIDEAHERTLNVDLLLGVLKRLLPRRPELKLIVTSATLDIERVSNFFGDAPIITVSGRNHPIEVRYLQSAEADEDPDLPLAVLEACQEITTEPGEIGNGDILVFLPGEREIRDVGELLERELGARVEVLSLYSRLSWEQQSKIFQRGSRQRIVLSTNVAETSITVPGIRAVIDSGLARISRYSVRNRLQRLPIEPVSRASADQRKGRCGRLAAGLCMRLYTEEDFEQRTVFTEPEVLRTNLAALLLRLAADGLGQAEDFPFIDAPDSRALNDGYRLLQELQALDDDRRITRRGRAMARLPLDPRLSRALLESKRFHAESELLAIVAGLSVPDVRLGDDPPEGAAFDDAKSEFSALLKLWRAYRAARAGPRRELRRWCKQHHLSVLRLSEWDDVYTQVVDRARELGLVAQGAKGSYTGVHRSLLAGFCTMVGTRGEEGVYLGTRGVHFHVFPGSPLARRRPRWVMAASIVETSRVFARRVAEVEPMWIESAAAHLVKREYLEPDWDEQREQVVARERTSFLGLILSAGRIVNYGPIAPEESRLIFSREALVYQRLQQRPDWLLANDAAVRQAQQMEERLRTRDLARAAESFVEFYDTRLPRQVSSAATLEHFNRHLSMQQRAALTLSPSDIFARLPQNEALAQFPENTRVDTLTVPVEYRFAPGESEDGANLKIPLLALPSLTREAIDAAIPGLAAPRIEALLRSLPKDARRSLIPVAAAAAAFLEDTQGAAADVTHLKTWLKERRGIAAALLRFDPAAVPGHLTPHLTVTQEGREIARGTDLSRLRRECAAAGRAELERHGRSAYAMFGSWRRFELDQLPERVPLTLQQGTIWVYPTLEWRESGLQVQYEWSADEAQRTWRDGSVRLARVMLERQSRDLAKSIGSSVSLLLRASPYLGSDALIDAVLQLTFREACFAEIEAPRTKAEFETAVDKGRERLYPCLEQMSAMIQGWFKEASEVRQALDDSRVPLLAEAAEETRGHLQRLLNFATIGTAPLGWLRQIPRYLKAEQRRWQRNSVRGNEPKHVAQELEQWSARYLDLELRLTAEMRWTPKLSELRFWIEEYRVSLYAQELKTLGAISAARLSARAVEIEAWLSR
ncbi:MAG: ATP-dependent RNA helicase HrpA [Steroidobacteraceae bacterium]